MTDILCTHANYIIEDCNLLLDQIDASLNATQEIQIQRIQANAVEFVDVWRRLMAMPLYEIAGILNHDVRNIITPIFGYAELIATGIAGDLSPQQLIAAERICHNAHVLLEEMNRILGAALKQRDTMALVC